MSKRKLYFPLFLLMLFACNLSQDTTDREEQAWRLGWRMIETSWQEDYTTAAAQFDSLLEISGNDMNINFLTTGLVMKSMLGKTDDIDEILSSLPADKREYICTGEVFSAYEYCEGFQTPAVKNPDLQQKLIEMYVDDQVVRGNRMEDIIRKYNIDTTEITTNSAITVDEQNREKLKAIIQEYGFPTREMVGKDAMRGIFMIIQHADRDTEWQQSQLPNIKQAADRGDLDAQSYAYLYDRVQVNAGEKQLYGTQFKDVDMKKGVAILALTEDMENLNKRRMELGMMPIEMYTDLMLGKR